MSFWYLKYFVQDQCSERILLSVPVSLTYLFYCTLAFLSYQISIKYLFSLFYELSTCYSFLNVPLIKQCTQHQLVTFWSLAYKLHCQLSKLVFIIRHCSFKLLPQRTPHYKTFTVSCLKFIRYGALPTHDFSIFLSK